MIIRILGEGQFLLDEVHLEKVNAIDNQIVVDVTQGNKVKYEQNLAKLISTVKELGQPLDPARIIASDIIIPPPDMSLEEARKVFAGEGLIRG
jgi:hypothetical protein